MGRVGAIGAVPALGGLADPVVVVPRRHGVTVHIEEAGRRDTVGAR